MTMQDYSGSQPRDATPELIGERILLRPAKESDRADRLECGRDLEFRRMVGGDPRDCPPLTATELDRWFGTVTTEPFHWIIEFEGRCIGTAQLHSVDLENLRARYAVGIFESKLWGKGLGSDCTRLALKYAFEVLCLHRVDLRVLSFNVRAIACYEKCGFVREGVEREGALIGGEWQSDVVMSILDHEYFAPDDNLHCDIIEAEVKSMVPSHAVPEVTERIPFPEQGANGFDRSLFRANLRLTPTQRIEQLQRAIVSYLEVRRAGRTARLSRSPPEV